MGTGLCGQEQSAGDGLTGLVEEARYEGASALRTALPPRTRVKHSPEARVPRDEGTAEDWFRLRGS